MPEISLIEVRPEEIEEVVPFVAAYHAFENIALSDAHRRRSVDRLLGEPELGSIWWIIEAKQRLGYIALCYGYSIEFGGRDAFIDEFYLLEDARGRGIGTEVLNRIAERMRNEKISALHLEVALTNSCAKGLYEKCGFESREKYHLMSRYLT